MHLKGQRIRAEIRILKPYNKNFKKNLKNEFDDDGGEAEAPLQRHSKKWEAHPEHEEVGAPRVVQKGRLVRLDQRGIRREGFLRIDRKGFVVISSETGLYTERFKQTPK